MSYFRLTLFLILAMATASRGADSGNDVVVVYNTRLPESKSVAEYYAQRRNVPADQVLGFPMNLGEEISRPEFQDTIQKPLAKALESKKLWHIASEVIPGTNGGKSRLSWMVKTSKIRYLVLCYGVPVHIGEDPGLKEKIDDTRPELRRNESAVDSELALLPGIEQHLTLGGPVVNPVFSATNAALIHPTHGVLMVARLDGPTAAIARGLVDKAIQAENEGLWGRAYFDLRGTTNPGYKMGDDWIRAASENCKHLGFETIVDDKPGTFSVEFPMSQIAIYCGWYDEHASGPFTRTNVEFMPGAFAYHLHSFSAAILRTTTNRWVGPLLAKGATVTMGCVAEPYLMGTPDVGTFCGRFIALGFSFGEAACVSQSVLSWQTTVIGDPLYRPFGRSPALQHEELERSHNPLVEWSYLRLVNLNLQKGKRADEMTDFLEPFEITRRSPVLNEKLGDLYAAEGKPNAAAAAYEKSLKLGPSRQQRVRLRLNIAEKLLASDRKPDAYADLRKLLEEDPDYPARFTILKQVLSLAIELGNKDEITRCVQDMTKYGEETTRKAEEQEKAERKNL